MKPRTTEIARLLLASIAAEIGVVVVWTIVVIVIGLTLRNPDRTHALLAAIGQSATLILGFVLCVAAGWWAARRSTHALLLGFAVGLGCAILDAIVISIVAKAFFIIPVFGLFARILGGGIGGWIARARKPQQIAINRPAQLEP